MLQNTSENAQLWQIIEALEAALQARTLFRMEIRVLDGGDKEATEGMLFSN